MFNDKLSYQCVEHPSNIQVTVRSLINVDAMGAQSTH